MLRGSRFLGTKCKIWCNFNWPKNSVIRNLLHVNGISPLTHMNSNSDNSWSGQERPTRKSAGPFIRYEKYSQIWGEFELPLVCLDPGHKASTFATIFVRFCWTAMRKPFPPPPPPPQSIWSVFSSFEHDFVRAFFGFVQKHPLTF